MSPTPPTPPPRLAPLSRRGFFRQTALGTLAGWAAVSAPCLVAPGCRTANRSPQDYPGYHPRMRAAFDRASRQYLLTDDGQPVLRYNYWPVQPGAVLERIAPGNRIYAVARSDYLHPLFGLEGEELTRDWSVDHPHHRGIYWAWPEVDWRGQRGDLHALQKVFARPTQPCLASSGPVYAQLEANNLWHWETGPAIVRETARLRAWPRSSTGRLLDLEFRFAALGDPVALARRGTNAYGGLNLRFNHVEGQQLVKHTDPPGTTPRRAWAQISGRFGAAASPCAVVILQHPANPDYPGDWVDYPELNWLQPTFPNSGTRFVLEPARPLVLRYRLWIHPGGPAAEDACRRAWDDYHQTALPTLPLASVESLYYELPV